MMNIINILKAGLYRLLNLKAVSLALLVLLGAGTVTAAKAAEDNREADHAALRALRDKAAAAIDKQDMKALASCFAKESAFIAVNQTVVTNETQMQEFFDRMFKSSEALVTSLKTEPKADILTRFLDANTGYCYGTSTDTYTLKSGKVVQMNVRWSATVVKENGEWKVAIAHVGTDFLDNPVLDAAKAFAKNVGLGAGLGGLLFGVVAGVLLGRAKRAS
jgi:ketosteroid isomerase-like protein